MKTTQWHPTAMKKTMSKALRSACMGLALSLTLGGPVALTARADQHGPVSRTVEGTVHGSNDAPLAGAIVYLKDTKSLAVKSFVSTDEGIFHFGQLSQNTDYEIYAEFGGKRSKSKNISSFDSKNSFSFTLKIDATK